jgi:hypothetical protein
MFLKFFANALRLVAGSLSPPHLMARYAETHLFAGALDAHVSPCRYGTSLRPSPVDPNGGQSAPALAAAPAGRPIR